MNAPRARELATVVANGLLAGASLDQSIKQVPARRTIGSTAYAAYARAADGGNGIAWYATLGVGTAALTLVTTATTIRAADRPRRAQGAAAAGALTLAHSAVTTQAAPIMRGLRHTADDERALTPGPGPLRTLANPAGRPAGRHSRRRGGRRGGSQ